MNLNNISTDPNNKIILLFDGVCNLCQSSVNFIIKRNRLENIYFASLQSEFGQKQIEHFGLKNNYLDSIILIENNHVYSHSKAALRITRYLDNPWPIFTIFSYLPSFISDFFYKIIARNRYRWFGKKDVCMLPSPTLLKRFLG